MEREREGSFRNSLVRWVGNGFDCCADETAIAHAMGFPQLRLGGLGSEKAVGKSVDVDACSSDRAPASTQQIEFVRLGSDLRACIRSLVVALV